MFTLLAVSLLILHAFSLFFFLFLFSLSMCPLLRCASRYVYLLSLSLVLPLLIPFFFENSLLFIFLLFSKKKTSFFIFSLLFCKTVFVPSPLLFRPFSCLFLFFQSCSFEQDKLTFFFWQRNHLFNTSVPFFKKLFFLNFLENST